MLNVTGPETIPARRIATLLAEAMGKDVEFTGVEAPDAGRHPSTTPPSGR
ncbi:hypothetical protein [Kutzneria sp. CA-103260]|nr:hypothetical protein [Kutzneria sp. CA-103260]